MGYKAIQNTCMTNDKTGIIAQVDKNAGTHVELASWLGLLVSTNEHNFEKLRSMKEAMPRVDLLQALEIYETFTNASII
jgi:hypothetical protein